MTTISSAAVASLLPTGHVKKQRRIEKVVVGALALIASSGVIITLGIVFSLVQPTYNFFTERAISGYASDETFVGIEESGAGLRDSSDISFADESLIQYADPVSLGDFFGSTAWYPQYEEGDFGVWPLIVGTLLVMLTATIVAVPAGIGIAFFLNQYANDRTRRFLKPLLEVLAGVPTVVFGFFALVFVGPYIAKNIWPFSDVGIYSGLAAGITVGLMILPMMATLADDAMAAVPNSLVEGAFALGATRREVCTGVILPAGLSGIMAAVIIALSRAIGETTIVLLAAGSQAVWTFNLGSEMQTMASYIGFAGIGDQPVDSKGYQTIFAVGLLLFIITFGLNMLSRKVVKRFREVYE
jgi:phosphate transport system permease protein